MDISKKDNNLPKYTSLCLDYNLLIKSKFISEDETYNGYKEG